MAKIAILMPTMFMCILHCLPTLQEPMEIFISTVNWLTGALMKTKMEYNYERKAYEIVMLLKQGYYEYQYLLCQQIH